VDGRVLGVLFFDYVSATTATMDIALAKAIADRCGMFIERLASETSIDP
jgi:hypothetical protein